MREDAATKAWRLLVEGRLLVQLVDQDRGRVMVTVRGDSGERYAVRYKRGVWAWSCSARGNCSHLRAVWLVTVAPRAAKVAP